MIAARLTAIAVLACGCTGSGKASSDAGGIGDGGSHDGGDRGSDAGATDGGFSDIACTGSLSGGLNGALGDCSTSYVFVPDTGSPYTTIGVDQLNGVPLEVGSCDFDFALSSAAETARTYTFQDVHGVANLYQNHTTQALTIWACGSIFGSETLGSGLALSFTSMYFAGKVSGTSAYKVHGQVACQLEADDGSPPIDLTLAF